MASYYQPAVDPSHPDAQLQPQDSYPHSYDYAQASFMDVDAGVARSWEHTASSPDSEAEYPYYPGHTLLRFEEALANDYLAIPPGYPPADNYTAAAADTYGLSDLNQSSYPPATPMEDAYAQWYTTSTTLGFQPATVDYAQAPQPREHPPMAESSYGTVTSTYSTLADAFPSSYENAYAATLANSSVALPSQYMPSQYIEVTSAEPMAGPAVQPRARRSARRNPEAEPSCPYPNPTAAAEPSTSESRDGTTKLVATPRRNATVSADAPRPSTPANRWKCPHCLYVQSNKRTPDFNRHLLTHTGNKADWVCCGVPLIDAGEHEVPMEVQLAEPFEYQGMFMVGGCWKTFSRKDALARHLRKFEGVCFGDAGAPYMPGNKGGAH